MKMPDKNPDLWAALLAWLSINQPQIYAGGMAAIVAVLRVIYGGGGRRQMLMEGALCGLIGMSIIPLLEYFSLPAGLASFAGCMVGFIGVEKLREWAVRLGERKGGS